MFGRGASPDRVPECLGVAAQPVCGQRIALKGGTTERNRFAARSPTPTPAARRLHHREKIAHAVPFVLIVLAGRRAACQATPCSSRPDRLPVAADRKDADTHPTRPPSWPRAARMASDLRPASCAPGLQCVFQVLAHRDMAEVLDDPQFDQRLRQQAQGPARMLRWRGATGEHGQLGFYT